MHNLLPQVKQKEQPAIVIDQTVCLVLIENVVDHIPTLSGNNRHNMFLMTAPSISSEPAILA